MEDGLKNSETPVLNDKVKSAPWTRIIIRFIDWLSLKLRSKNGEASPLSEKIKRKHWIRIFFRFLISLTLILTIVLSAAAYIGFIYAFEYRHNNKPTELAEFSKEVVDLKKYMSDVQESTRSILANHLAVTGPRAEKLQTQIDVLNENLKSAGARMNELEKAIYANQGKIQDNYINGRRISVIFGSLVMVFLLKMFAGFYHDNAHKQACDEKVVDALVLLQIDRKENTSLDIPKFSALMKILSVKDQKMETENNFFPELIKKRKPPKPKNPDTTET